MRSLQTVEHIKDWINEELSSRENIDCKVGSIYRLEEFDENGSNWTSQTYIGIKEFDKIYRDVVDIAKTKFNLAD